MTSPVSVASSASAAPPATTAPAATAATTAPVAPSSSVLEAVDLVMDYRHDLARARTARTVTGEPRAPIADALAQQPLALNHVHCVLHAGESVAVMGPSGSGKSTLLHAMAGIIRPTGGEVLYHGGDIGAMTDRDRTALRRRSFGFVFQSGQLLPELGAVENIALPMMLDGAPYDQAADAAVLWLERLGLRALAAQRPGEMSGGQMQRVAIARALCIHPDVVFADEPTGALDQITGREVMDILMRAARSCDAAVIVVTHDPNVARCCQRTLMMRDGRLLPSQTPEVSR
ncbi:ABC transporter ATP-binding protein [Bifidobacterium mongoliense]|uniref:ABC transporter ATP-binding protein n=1 Tax=Bifidobacterium mongoliense TaxID=518643 RepID=UPI003F517B1E